MIGLTRQAARAALALTFLSAAGAAAAPSARPNVLVIVADDMGYGDLGVHGCKDIPSPHIDSLAANGVRATSGYVSGPYCSPTRAGLLTGRYQQRFGHEFNPGAPAVGSDSPGLPRSETTMAERFKQAGYATGMVGKWHLGASREQHPLARGFDEYFGFLGGAHTYLPIHRSGTPAADTPQAIRRGYEAINEQEYLTDAFRREAIAFLDRHPQDPWFLYLAFNAVHGPMEAIEKYLERFPQITDPKRRTYAAMLAAMDDAVGAVLDKLRQQGNEENTVIFFISDNGGPEAVNASNNGPLRGNKGTTWEGGVRVPWMVQWKGTLPAGKVYDQPVIQLDVLPTALAAAGIGAPSDARLDGVNLLPYFNGDKTGPPHAALYWRFGGQTAIRSGDWKLVKAPQDGLGSGESRRAQGSMEGAQLFNLREDIGEQRDLANAEPDRVKHLSDHWNAWNAQLVEPLWGGGSDQSGGKGTNPKRAAKRAERAAARQRAN